MGGKATSSPETGLMRSSVCRFRFANRIPLRSPICGAIILLAGVPTFASPNAALSEGKEHFHKNCAICHGVDGKGGGAFSELLNISPPDLTILSRKNKGSFPYSDVYNSIDGRDFPRAHGESDMPIWGERFKRSVEGGNETLIRGRMMEIILYLKSLQQF